MDCTYRYKVHGEEGYATEKYEDAGRVGLDIGFQVGMGARGKGPDIGGERH